MINILEGETRTLFESRVKESIEIKENILQDQILIEHIFSFINLREISS